MNYYNENDRDAAEWLRNLIADGLIPNGHVDSRSIANVQPDDIAGYQQCHFFAGIGGWAHAVELAGWPEDRPIWTGSCPCQPFSVAGGRTGSDDARHLWPDFFRLIYACRPPVVMGEQVAGKAGFGWFDGVRSDLEGGGYACRAVDIPACAVDAPHIRSRLYWVAKDVADTAASREGWRQLLRPGKGSNQNFERSSNQSTGPNDSSLGNHNSTGLLIRQGESRDARTERQTAQRADSSNSAYSDHEWITCHDGKSRRTKSGVSLLANGIQGRLAFVRPDGEVRQIRRTVAWRGLGNAIVIPLAVEVIKAFMETEL